MEMKSLEVLIAHSNPKTHSTIEQGVFELGHRIVSIVHSGEGMIEACQKQQH